MQPRSRRILLPLATVLAALSLACGSPISIRGPYGIVGLLTLVLWVWALVDILQSGKRTGDKVLWVLVVIILPVIGSICWFIFGKR